MPSTQRRAPTGLIGRLIKQPFRFHFFQAVRLIERWLRRDAAAHGKQLETVLRCKNSIALGFAPSQIEALAIEADRADRPDKPETAETPDTPSAGEPLAPAMDRLRQIRITPAFMGFLGVNGVLPYDYTATIAAQITFDKNHAGRAFFDTFSHRMMVLFYRAWAVCHIESGADADGRDRFMAAQLALAGRLRRPQPAPAGLAAAAIPDEVVARYAALIRHRPVQADMVADLCPIALDNCTRLGRASGLLSAPPATDHAEARYLIAF